MGTDANIVVDALKAVVEKKEIPKEEPSEEKVSRFEQKMAFRSKYPLQKDEKLLFNARKKSKEKK